MNNYLVNDVLFFKKLFFCLRVISLLCLIYCLIDGFLVNLFYVLLWFYVVLIVYLRGEVVGLGYKIELKIVIIYCVKIEILIFKDYYFVV